MNIFRSLFIFAFIIQISICKLYDINVTNVQEIKLQPHQQIIFSPFPGISIDRLSIKKVIGDSSFYSTLCQVVPAHIVSSVQSLAVFQEASQAPKILSSLQQLQVQTNLEKALKLFSISYSGDKRAVEIYEYRDQNNTLAKYKTIKYQKQISAGYFVQTTDVLLYVSSQELIRITDHDTFEIIEGYGPHETFLYPYLFNKSVLFVAQESNTITKYDINLKSDSISAKFNDIELEDFSYDQNRNLVMLLDYKKGVHFFNLNPNNTLTHYPEQKISVPNCQNMVFKNDFLYITCPHLYKYNIKSFQLQKQVIPLYPQDLIVTQNNQIILKGSSHIIFYRRWESRPITFQLIQPTKMEFNNDSIVYINNHQLIKQSIKIFPDVLRCSADESHQPGTYIVNIFSSGACANNRADQLSINNTCLYVRNIEVQVWAPYQIYWLVMEIVMIGLAIGVFVSVLWCMIKKITLNRSQKYLELIQQKQVEILQQNNQNTQQNTQEHISKRNRQENFEAKC